MSTGTMVFLDNKLKSDFKWDVNISGFFSSFNTAINYVYKNLYTLGSDRNVFWNAITEPNASARELFQSVMEQMAVQDDTLITAGRLDYDSGKVKSYEAGIWKRTLWSPEIREGTIDHKTGAYFTSREIADILLLPSYGIMKSRNIPVSEIHGIGKTVFYDSKKQFDEIVLASQAGGFKFIPKMYVGIEKAYQDHFFLSLMAWVNKVRALWNIDLSFYRCSISQKDVAKAFVAVPKNGPFTTSHFQETDVSESYKSRRIAVAIKKIDRLFLSDNQFQRKDFCSLALNQHKEYNMLSYAQYLMWTKGGVIDMDRLLSLVGFQWPKGEFWLNKRLSISVNAKIVRILNLLISSGSILITIPVHMIKLLKTAHIAVVLINERTHQKQLTGRNRRPNIADWDKILLERDELSRLGLPIYETFSDVDYKKYRFVVAPTGSGKTTYADSITTFVPSKSTKGQGILMQMNDILHQRIVVSPGANLDTLMRRYHIPELITGYRGELRTADEWKSYKEWHSKFQNSAFVLADGLTGGVRSLKVDPIDIRFGDMKKYPEAVVIPRTDWPEKLLIEESIKKYPAIVADLDLSGHMVYFCLVYHFGFCDFERYIRDIEMNLITSSVHSDNTIFSALWSHGRIAESALTSPFVQWHTVIEYLMTVEYMMYAKKQGSIVKYMSLVSDTFLFELRDKLLALLRSQNPLNKILL
jgi:hypothetical protein